ncbi:ParA family protein [Streptomyces scabiei]|uniref:ParA family protein n=1 Tax=Streptomyces scabiei TaxID=1930 RepID=UPI0004E61A97|nr:ParA family protein [Streptomyces scabiei]KFG06974.1 phosphopantetheine--protein transferase [Streptomyces scabiei]MDX2835441.1 ParA family protein [Streptomyces scabiei]MDX3680515.1 ParA family protein [Streptomyces scabiei]
MTVPYDPSDREKVVAKLPAELRKELKIRAAELGTDIQDAVTAGVEAWRKAKKRPAVDTSGGTSFATYLPAGLYDKLKTNCKAQGISYNQGIAQSIRLWLDGNPSPRPKPARVTGARRVVFGNQKGGVGKTSVSAGVAQALAESGHRTLLIDFDPQGHLTKQLGHPLFDIDAPSLAKHMLGDAKGELRDLLTPIKGGDFEDHLWLLPACKDAFLLDAKLATSRSVRIKETALEKALELLEQDFDYILVDCPPSLGYSMDTALYYSRTREGEDDDTSGIVIPVLAEDSSADAYDMLFDQVQDLVEDMDIDIAMLGFVVNMYDSRKGFVATSSLDAWQNIGDPPVLAIVPELKDQREAVRVKQPLLVHAPYGEQSEVMRTIARRISA